MNNNQPSDISDEELIDKFNKVRGAYIYGINLGDIADRLEQTKRELKEELLKKAELFLECKTRGEKLITVNKNLEISKGNEQKLARQNTDICEELYELEERLEAANKESETYFKLAESLEVTLEEKDKRIEELENNPLLTINDGGSVINLSELLSLLDQAAVHMKENIDFIEEYATDESTKEDWKRAPLQWIEDYKKLKNGN